MVIQPKTLGMWELLNPSDVITIDTELEGLRALDPQAFSAVYTQYYPIVLHFVRYRLGDENMAEDIANDVFTRLLEAVRDRRGPDKNLKAWLLATASHAINDSLRKSYRRKVEPLDTDLIDRMPVPAEIMESNESKQAIRLALSTLKPDLQNVLALRFGQGFSLEETATLLKKKANHIKQLQFRALAALHQAMEEAADE
jgi:RNA polymerase sigma-70 factor, ECF subfamily